MTPRVDLVIRNGVVNIPDDVMTMRLNMMVTATVSAVAREIAKFHQGAVNNITICKDHFESAEALDPTATLEKCGITGGEVRLYYDFKPITYPLLG